MYAADNLVGLWVFTHRHTGELLEQLGVSAETLTFTPHLLPIPRGILSTIYVRFATEKQTNGVSIEKCFEFYQGSPMVRLIWNHAAADSVFGAHQLLRYRLQPGEGWQARVIVSAAWTTC
jgi:N-acetyl-gamma-glutamylphosphate reductase